MVVCPLVTLHPHKSRAEADLFRARKGRANSGWQVIRGNSVVMLEVC